jgi:hypothetical protein
MCKEMPVIPVNRLVDKIKIIGKNEGRGGGEVQGVADPPPTHTHQKYVFHSFYLRLIIAAHAKSVYTSL